MSVPQQQQSGDEMELAKLVIIAIVGIVILVALIATQEMRINAVVGAITWVHILPFAMATKVMPFLSDIPFIGPWLFGYSAQGLAFLEKGGYAAMPPEARTAVLVAGGRCATIIYGLILIWIALRGQEFRVDQKYQTSHTLESMIYVQSENWLTSRIARHVNPLKGMEIDARRLAETAAQKIEKESEMPGQMLPRGMISLIPGTWNRSLRPEEWLIGQGLSFDAKLHQELKAPDRSAAIADFEFKTEWERFDLEEISELLSSQLRSPWHGAAELRPSLRAIYAVMALFYDYDIDGGNKLLNDLGLLADASKAKRGRMDATMQAENGMMARIDSIALGEQGKKLARIAENHAWVESAFPTMLAAARKDRGVLPPASFLWLKAEDRLMWYILNNVGNNAVMIEAAGALAHCRAEVQLARPVRRPAVYQAARALLEDYLDMTPARIESRKQKEIRRRTLGDQMTLMRDEVVGEQPLGILAEGGE